LRSKYVGQDVQQKNTISAGGSGEVYANPDLAVVDFTVVTDAATVAEATQNNTTAMNAVNAAVKAAGVADSDLKTTNYSIYPLYDYVQASCVPPCPEGKRVLTGYEVSQTLEVKIRDLTKTGQIIEAATAAGANQVGDLQFTVENPDQYTAQAREQAIAEAKSKAQSIANQLGVELGRITGFSESGSVPSPIIYTESAAAGAGGAAVTPTVQPGQNKITDNVTVTYEIE